MSSPVAAMCPPRELDEALAPQIRFARSISGKPKA
jgi:hypothetical protein